MVPRKKKAFEFSDVPLSGTEGSKGLKRPDLKQKYCISRIRESRKSEMINPNFRIIAYDPVFTKSY